MITKNKKEFYKGLLQKEQCDLWSYELNQAFHWKNIEDMRKKKDELKLKAAELEEALIEKRKLPKIDMDEIKKEADEIHRLKVESGMIKREKEDYSDKEQQQVKFRTLDELMQGEEMQIKEQIKGVEAKQISIQFLKDEIKKL